MGSRPPPPPPSAGVGGNSPAPPPPPQHMQVSHSQPASQHIQQSGHQSAAVRRGELDDDLAEIELSSELDVRIGSSQVFNIA